MDDEPRPQREEICRASLAAFANFLQKKKPRVFWWNPLDEKWERVKRARPGQVYLIDRESGGYSDELGWTGDAKDKPSITAASTSEPRDAISRGRDSFVGRFVLLDEHTADVFDETEKLIAALSLDDASANALRNAARWHDVGKTHEEFQKMLRVGAPDQYAAKLLAKSAKREGRCQRRNFRHELASGPRLAAKRTGRCTRP